MSTRRARDLGDGGGDGGVAHAEFDAVARVRDAPECEVDDREEVVRGAALDAENAVRERVGFVEAPGRGSQAVQEVRDEGVGRAIVGRDVRREGPRVGRVGDASVETARVVWSASVGTEGAGAEGATSVGRTTASRVTSSPPRHASASRVSGSAPRKPRRLAARSRGGPSSRGDRAWSISSARARAVDAWGTPRPSRRPRGDRARRSASIARARRRPRRRATASPRTPREKDRRSREGRKRVLRVRHDPPRSP